MKKTVITAIVVLAAIIGGIFTIMSCTMIGTGKVGVVYSMRGGVRDKTLSQGLHFINPFLKVKEFTIGNEQLILSMDKREGSEGDDSCKVATSDDARIAISFQMSYRYKPETVVDTYKKFKGMSGTDIVEQRVKTVVKSKISEITTTYSLMDIYSGNRSEINNKITEYLNKDFGDMYGIEVLDASIIDVHPDEQLSTAIDARVKALQEKQQAQAEQEKVKVEAETKKIQAKGEADATIVAAQAEAEAYRIKSDAITDNLLKKWELDARNKHGWVTIQGANTIVKDAE